MDDRLISLTIGRTILLVLGLLLLVTGAGIVMALQMRGGGCPCLAMLRGEGHTRN